MVDGRSGWAEFCEARERFRSRLAGQAQIARLEVAFAAPALDAPAPARSPRMGLIRQRTGGARQMADDWNQPVIDEFRANAGKVGGFFEGADMLLLHSTGAKTGEKRTNPLLYIADDGGRMVVFATNGGADRAPDWYHNLLANPEVTVEVGTGTRRAVASPVTGEERDRLYAEMVRRRPQFADYELKTTRTIQGVALAPVD
jgi:deazaflavin-dependent oxidoreductase (nitroreductase family)